MKTIFMGTPEFAIPSLDIINKNTDLQLIITKEDKINARGNKIIFSPVKQYAIDNNIEYIQPKSIRTEDIINRIKDIKPDLIIVVAYGKIIPNDIINIPRLGIINVHSSLLPKYRGAAPIHAAIIAGEIKTGVSIMYIDEGLDTGDVINTLDIDILEEDTVGTLHDKLMVLGADALYTAIENFKNNKIKSTKQDDNKATIVRTFKKEDTLIDWEKTPKDIYNKVRGMNPFPTAYSMLNANPIKIYKVKKQDIIYEQGIYGEVVDFSSEGPVVKVMDGSVILLEVRYPGKKNQTGKDIINGRKIKIGERFENE